MKDKIIILIFLTLFSYILFRDISKAQTCLELLKLLCFGGLGAFASVILRKLFADKGKNKTNF